MKTFNRLVGAAAVAIVLVAAPQVRVLPLAAAGQDHDHQAAADGKTAPATEQHQGMMMSQGMMMNMMADMQASDAKLAALVQTMNAAKGAEKTDAMATLLTALVKEHSNMHSSMMNMMGGGMGMMNNMPGGMKMPDKAKP